MLKVSKDSWHYNMLRYWSPPGEQPYLGPCNVIQYISSVIVTILFWTWVVIASIYNIPIMILYGVGHLGYNWTYNFSEFFTRFIGNIELPEMIHENIQE
jgi:hypothetical protein